MNTERDKMIKSLNEVFIPELRNRNFKGSFPHFRKTENGKTNLLTFQFDRNSGGFIVELANWNEPEFKTHWGKLIPLNKLTAHDLFERKRLYPNSTSEESGTESWFRYDRNNDLNIENRFELIAKSVLNKIPIMEEYWKE